MTRSGSVTGPDRRPVTETARRTESRGGQEFGTALSAQVATDAARAKAVLKQATQDRFAQNQALRYQFGQSQAAHDRRAQAWRGAISPGGPSRPNQSENQGIRRARRHWRPHE